MRENFWHWFSHLHPVERVLLLIALISLLIVAALNHSVEENLINLMFAIQALVISSKMPRKEKKDQ